MKKPDFIAKLNYKSTKQGGRRTPAFSNYRPHIQFSHIPFFKTSGQQVFLDKEVVHPGDSVTAEITVISYLGLFGNLNVGDKFDFCEASRIIGSGEVIELLNLMLLNTLTTEERDLLIKRLNTAIDFAKEGQFLHVNEKLIQYSREEGLSIIGFSKWKKINSLSKSRVHEEIQELKNEYANWLGLTTKFLELEGWQNPSFNLNLPDSKNSIGICSVRNDKIKWLIELNQ
ncbi:MAG: hypothetical protein RJQ09_07450 [Cyclobacteriaceae bacterium]